ncbi:hypothetical protein VTK56DRAFT_6948 [Thermocarpiscus australiensis]
MVPRSLLSGLLPVICSLAAFNLVMVSLFAGNKPGILAKYDIISVNTSGLGKDLVNRLPPSSLVSSTATSKINEVSCNKWFGRPNCDFFDWCGLFKGRDPACHYMNNVASSTQPRDTVGASINEASCNKWFGRPNCDFFNWCGLFKDRDPACHYVNGPPSSTHPRDTVGESINNMGNDIVEGLAEKVHIPDFYSLYALGICDGDFAADGSRNITECHSYFSDEASIPTLLNHTLQTTLTPPNLNLSLSDLGMSCSLQDELDSLQPLLKAFAVIFATGAGLTGVSILSSIVGALLCAHASSHGCPAAPLSIWGNILVASTAVFLLVLGGLMATVGARIAAAKVNLEGAEFGITAVAGTGWVILTWVGVLLMGLALACWVWSAVSWRKGRVVRRGGGEEWRTEEGAPTKGLLDGVHFSSVRARQ